MKLTFATTRADDDALLIHPVAKGGEGGFRRAELEEAGNQLIAEAALAGRFEGDAGAITEVFVPADGRVARVALLGVGAGGEEEWAKAASALVARYLIGGPASVTVDLTGVGATLAAVARFAAVIEQRSWRYDIYRTKLADKQKPSLTEVVIVGGPDGVADAWAEQSAVTQGMALTRELVAEPANIIFPESFVERVTRSVEGLGLSVEVLDEAAMRALGMGALLAVSQGSIREARLLALRWDGAGAGAPTTALVGKGVTFDTGGISIKPAAGMEDMKWDMGGAGAVAGAMKALALRKASANVVGVMGLVENMPDGGATRPGDVVTSMNGQTIEVINTDAEGRLVLADAITWVQRTHNPTTIVDLATLTGAMIVSLGNEYGGLFSNDEDLARQLLDASTASGDKLWRFPLAEAYDKLIDSPIADMKNVGPRGAGSITAAQFIRRFVDEGVRWAHLDIAGMVWSDKDGIHHAKGATGYGVRLLDRFVHDTCEG
ncbi:leucyl aminopeptidase [Sphingomonas guangdongensis]|uniref:Probable cytosol aminopeptidase n=1 Tax=Sphingomonas guangdongensis TaxID=1141890 RepID=A0A285R146_9SPHN|nr:leucyl aminopeptidase [Sphingomonas guangdongensis]SOB87544.1 leucyl aminopeptidase [Sphingomonas guangdongensis]